MGGIPCRMGYRAAWDSMPRHIGMPCGVGFHVACETVPHRGTAFALLQSWVEASGFEVMRARRSVAGGGDELSLAASSSSEEADERTPGTIATQNRVSCASDRTAAQG